MTIAADTSREAPLAALLPSTGETLAPDAVLDRFVSWVGATGLTLYPHQEEAILELLDGRHVILNTPTGSGKSLVATFLHFKALAAGQRSFYTCPIKALVNEKFFALCRLFGPENVGMMTGDAAVNRDAPIVCCTAEILTNIALREAAAATSTRSSWTSSTTTPTGSAASPGRCRCSRSRTRASSSCPRRSATPARSRSAPAA